MQEIKSARPLNKTTAEVPGQISYTPALLRFYSELPLGNTSSGNW